MPRYSDWYPMSRLPEYSGSYEARTEHSTTPAVFSGVAWEGDSASYLQWRGKKTILSKTEKEKLLKTLYAHAGGSEETRCEAAEAAIRLARAAQEFAARDSRKRPLIRTLRFFRIAQGLQANLNQPHLKARAALQPRDNEVLVRWWAKLREQKRWKIEIEVERFLAGQNVQLL